MKKLIEKYFLPSEYVNRFSEISVEMLKNKNKKAVMIDLDNTLVAFDDSNANEEVLNWIKELKENEIEVLILSNGNRNRVERFAIPHDLNYIHSARKPLMKNFHLGLRMLNVLKREVVMVGDQLMTDVLGANRVGVDSILVLPIKDKDGYATFLNRRMERVVMKWMDNKELINWRENSGNV
ncbi:YqeG family HAD IIIA-type phosphatase [Phocicoccus pinnipedialis]|uniref:Haloacid dehalogenase-like hydrolase n=1 Tax=Phocicoccus pinnipedialis TaxID=110845 RepID=A0A6V7RGJ9_9BACL|nr:YqeG family HAD IIIA-type phosphatase [Jeotgalicoccus pinnipedialis]MBP1939235.1 HAD superfamily phosphatase (TIGR01668 family) [Jeotgalicoccus pinnipedialis]CAD2076194.1 haloacid dehalogenase-like hydrolase [Jeotgalicoccus pinnipedialis]